MSLDLESRVLQPEVLYEDLEKLFSLLPSRAEYDQIQASHRQQYQAIINSSRLSSTKLAYTRELESELKSELGVLKEKRIGSLLHKRLVIKMVGLLPSSLVTDSCQQIILRRYEEAFWMGVDKRRPIGEVASPVSWVIDPDYPKSFGIFSPGSAKRVDEAGFEIANRLAEDGELDQSFVKTYAQELSEKYGGEFSYGQDIGPY